MTECYRCGQEGHTRSHCPQADPLPPAAPPSGRTAERHLRIVRDPAIATTWAGIIRKTLGWKQPPDDQEGTT